MFFNIKEDFLARFLLILVACIFLFGNLTVAEVSAQGKVFITMPTATVGGSYYAAGTVIANVLNEKLRDSHNIYVTAQSSKGSIENIEMLKNKEAEIAILNSSVYIPAYLGIEAFEGNKFEDLRCVAMLWANPMQMVVTRKSGIKNVSDLKGRKVSVGSPGSTSPITEIMIYGANLTFDDFQAEFLGFDQSVQAMVDGKIEAAQLSGAIPHPSVLELFSGKLDVDLISLDDSEISHIIEGYPYVTEFTIPKNTYPKQDYDVKTAAVTTVLVARKDLDEDTVYNITKALFESKKELAAAYDGLSDLSLDTAFKGFTVPFHKGAIKYYKELGLDVPESIIVND